MKKIILTISDPYGLHARKAANLVKEFKGLKSDIYVQHDGIEIDGKSILGLMSLSVGFEEKLTINISGHDEQEDLAHINNFLKLNKF